MVGIGKEIFEVQQMRPARWLKLGLISIEDTIVHWFQYWHIKTKNPSWKGFSKALKRRFSDNGKGSAYERLALWRQPGGVKEHTQEFELLVV